jgi:ACS family hexuronate transporter-like MFS transporter
MTPSAKTGYYRWVICGLLFFATTINYVDRQVIGILKSTLQGEFGWNEIDYSNIVFAFQTAYAIGLMLAGRLMDKLGTKAGYALALIVWSLAAVACAEATSFGPLAASLLATVGFVATPSVAGFMAARFALGLGEGGNFPAAIKSVAEWFPKRERALATGIFNSGTNVGAVVTPLVVPWITVRYGWYWAFVITGALGFFWLIAWWLMYDTPERHPRVTPAELAHIKSDPTEPTTPVPWAALFPHR